MPDGILDQQSQATQTTPPPTTQTAPEPNSWHASLPEDLRSNQSLGKFKDVGSLAKSYVELEKHQGGALRLPGEDAKPEDWDAFYNKLGRPESPDKYEVKRPELGEGIQWPEQTEKSFLQQAHKLGLNSKQAQGLMDWFAGDLKGVVGMQARQMQEQQQQLQADWGDKYQTNLSLAQRAAKEFLTDPQEIEYFKQSGLHQHPVVIKLFARLGKQLEEGSGLAAEGGQSSSQKSALEKIAEIRNNKSHPYHNSNAAGHKEAVAEMSRLYDQAYPD